MIWDVEKGVISSSNNRYKNKYIDRVYIKGIDRRIWGRMDKISKNITVIKSYCAQVCAGLISAMKCRHKNNVQIWSLLYNQQLSIIMQTLNYLIEFNNTFGTSCTLCMIANGVVDLLLFPYSSRPMFPNDRLYNIPQNQWTLDPTFRKHLKRF